MESAKEENYQKVVYTCPMKLKKEMLIKNPPRKINNLIVYSEKENIETIFPECVNCEKPHLAISLHEENKTLIGTGIKVCKIWRVKQQDQKK
jgi:hypothetical protein